MADDSKQVQPWHTPIYNEAMIAEQERVCFELRLRGMSVRDIVAHVAQEHGWSLSKSTVANRINACAKEATAELAEQVRGVILTRYDRLTSIVLATMEHAYQRNMFGQIMVDPETKQRLRDPAVIYAGVDRILKIDERRAKLVPGVEQTGPMEVVVHDAQSRAEALAIQELVNEARAMAANAGTRAEEVTGE